jgi:small subunit ribosomal protein S2
MSASISRKALLEVGAHFGHKNDKMNPKMKPYVYGMRSGINIIDLEKTVHSLKEAYEAMKKISADGGSILFVGTKKQTSDIIKEEAERAGVFYINHRWLGGLLTNFKTIRTSIDKLKKMETFSLDELTKKEKAIHERNKDKLTRNLYGVKEMYSIPDAIFICDTVSDQIAVDEAKKMGVTVFGIVDTNSNPDKIDHFIPCNDDAVRAVAMVLNHMAKAILEGKGVEVTDSDPNNEPLGQNEHESSANINEVTNNHNLAVEGDSNE